MKIKKPSEMKIAFIGTYPPRQCGIGTFTNNLVKAIVQNTPSKKITNHATVIAINEDDAKYEYPEEVKFIIRQNHQPDYINAAKFINYSDAEVCVLQHEFGIFGGDDGVFILPMLHRLEIPLIVTFHTVLKEPSYTQRSIVEEIGKQAARIVVMSKRAVQFLEEIYRIPREKIALIEHGVPEFERLSRQEAKQKHRLTGKKVLLTFGLLSRNKGIETAINALPKVVEKHPDVFYLVLGATHPNVLKHSGEEYRDYLLRLVKKLNLEKNVHFNNEFVTEEQLFEYLQACDIYITPYLNEPSKELRFTYDDEDTIEQKIEKIALNVYGARDVVFGEKAVKILKKIEGTSLEKMPVCIAKTQFSFSADPKAYGVVKNFRFKINDIIINQGAEFIVALAGEMMRMPGLPADPQAKRIDIVNGQIEGLS
jgi:glycosyltransferase involved in cell wall biosynthesis